MARGGTQRTEVQICFPVRRVVDLGAHTTTACARRPSGCCRSGWKAWLAKLVFVVATASLRRVIGPQ